MILQSKQKIFWAEPYNTNKLSFYLWYHASVIGRIKYKENQGVEIVIDRAQDLTENDFRDLHSLSKKIDNLFKKLHVS